MQGLEADDPGQLSPDEQAFIKALNEVSNNLAVQVKDSNCAYVFVFLHLSTPGWISNGMQDSL